VSSRATASRDRFLNRELNYRRATVSRARYYLYICISRQSFAKGFVVIALITVAALLDKSAPTGKELDVFQVSCWASS
jgi:hypothetical protein